MSAHPDPLRAHADAAAEGDDVALAELVRRTQPAVWRLCHHLGSPGQVEDLVQDTYLRALAALPGYRGDAPVQVWLLAIARRVCADHVRRRQRERRLMERVRAVAPRDEAPEPSMTADVLDVLDADRRAAFVLTQLLGLRYEEAAVVLDCPIGTVRSRVARARAVLAEQERSERAV